MKTDTGISVSCRIKGKFRTDQISSTNPVAVGDRVTISVAKNREEGVIQVIHDRKNYIVRKSVNLSKQIHIIAANIDIAFLLITLNNPVTYPAFIDRFLATAKAFGIEVVLLFTRKTLTRNRKWMNSVSLKLFMRISDIIVLKFQRSMEPMLIR